MHASRIVCGLLVPVLLATTTSAVLAAPGEPTGESRPVYGSWGFDAGGSDPATKPGDDFFRYANGTWLERTTIPPDKSIYSLRVVMSDWIEQRLHDLMEQPGADSGHAPTTLQGKVRAYYVSFMDEMHAERLGARPLVPELAAIRAVRSRADLAALMGRANAGLYDTIFAVGIDVDLKDPAHYALYVGQSGLGLPDRDYYLRTEFTVAKAAYQAYAARLLGLLNWPDPAGNARRVVDFETRLAAVSWTKVEQRDVDKSYNPMDRRELEDLTHGQFAWRRLLASAHLPAIERVIVGERSAFPRLASVYAETPLATLRAWAAFRAADNAAPYLSRAFADAHFELHGKTLSGQQEQRARWKRAITAVSGDSGSDQRVDTFGNMGFAVGQLYTARYFPPAAKANIEALAANLKSAYRARIENLDWMSPPTKTEALRKLDTYNIKVGYPDHPRDYSDLMIRDDDLLGNLRRTAAQDWDFHVKRYSRPVDRGDWSMTPQTNNAYNGSLRDIVIPAGVLQAPIFDVNADPAINYGAAGSYIAHELTHGFDDQGRKIDAEGRLRDWWAERDAAEFTARAARLIKQYSAFEPLPGVHVNGELTLGENIADLGGVAIALDAYRASLHGQPAPVLDGLTGEQRVLLGWAQAWRGKYRDDELRKMVATDPHSPRMFRANGVVRNLDAWYDAFGVGPGDKLYVDPADRVRIW